MTTTIDATATATAPSDAAVPVVAVPAGGRVVVASDLHLGALADAASEVAAAELARRIDELTGPAVLVLAGDCFELWAEPNNTPDKALRAHPRLLDAIGRFGAGAQRQVVVLAGNHDGALGWDCALAAQVRSALGAEVALAVDLDIATGAGPRRVRVEHGHQLDPHNAFLDPTRPGDRPLGQHVARHVVPAMARAFGEGEEAWLGDVAGLADPGSVGRFVASRLFYRRLARHLWWAAVPGGLFALAWLAASLVSPLRPALDARGGTPGVLAALALGLAADTALVGVGVAMAARRSVAALESLAGAANGAAAGTDANGAARRRAVQLQTDGYAGLVTGHTHQAELSELGGGFYANSGCNARLVRPAPARAGLPAVFQPVRRGGWVELEAGPELAVKLWVGQSPVAGGTAFERIVARRAGALPVRPAVVATLAPHLAWPPASRDRRSSVPRRAAVLVAAAGMLDVASALTPAVHARLHHVLQVVPPLLPATASLATAVAGLLLVLLASGLRRGQRRAWLLALAVLGGSVVTNLGKGLDVEEACFALGVALYLLARGGSFRAGSAPEGGRRAAVVLAGLGTATAAAAIAVAALAHAPVLHVLGAFGAHALGLGGPHLPRRWRTAGAGVTGLALGTAGYAVWAVLRPRAAAAEDPAAAERAWQLVRAHGGGTLDYFALRDDKARFVHGNTVVAYCVRHNVALVSPDPIGPADEAARAWAAFGRFAAAHGWSVAVLAASERWLPIYREAGMRAIYAGDEAVVDVARFSLEGGRNKGLRQAVNRCARAGFEVWVGRASEVDPARAAELRALLRASRRGDVERGYSMTLSRLFDPRDADLLLAVAVGPDGQAAAFCQFVPAPAIAGYSLDLMRRADGELPNGLTDLVIVRTIEYLQARGGRGLGLNFATMRAVLAGDAGGGWWVEVQRRLLRRLGRSMQIESLWRFTAKYDPTWAPRYLVVESADRLVSTALAVAGAESLWELPVIGRFLRPEAAGPFRGAEPAPRPVLVAS